MSLRKFNIFSSMAGAITPSYVSSASSDGGVVPDGSNATDPSLDVYEDMNVSNGNTSIKQEPGDVILRKATGPRYLYYRTYLKDGTIASNNPIYSNDQSLSRILTKSVAPPHTIASLKKHLCKIEGFPKDAAQSCYLFASLSDQKVMDEPAPVSLYGPSGPGLSEHDPVALVVGSERGSATAEPKDLSERPDARNPNYIYYRLYSPEGEIRSKMAFNESDNSLGRVGTLDIAPPHTVASLKACLIKVESMASPSQLFAVVNSEAPMSDNDPLQVLTDTYPGSDGDDPMAFVVDSDTPTPTSSTSKQVKSKTTSDYSARDPSWLSIVEGEILTTDNIIRSQIFKPYGGEAYEGYHAVNSSGKKGFVQAVSVEFC